MKQVFHYSDQKGQQKLCDSLLTIVKAYPEIVVVCVGTDRVSGDSLGPLVGTFLQEECVGAQVYGTLEYPVHAKNLEEIIQQIKVKHAESFVIAVDACLGKLENIENIMFVKGPLKPGIGVNKELPEVGTVNIQGIVNVGGFMPQLVIQNTRMNTVYNMAKVISETLSKTIKDHRSKDFRMSMNF